MACEAWIDAIAKLWQVSDGKGSTLRSYRVYERAEFPEALQPPCVLTYVSEVRMSYSLGGPCIELWNGVSEFHLTPDIGKHHYPAIMLFYARIRNAAAGSMKLGGLVDVFLLRDDEPSIRGPVVMQYGEEAPHLGLVVNWMVKSNVTGAFTPAA